MTLQQVLRRAFVGFALAGLISLGVSGCYDTSMSQVTLATPGQYKGQTDPLVAKLKPGGALEHKLQLRLKQADERR